MQIFRYLLPVLVVPVVLSGLAIIPSSASPDAPARGASADPAPVQLLDLTTRSGRTTEIARAGLDEAEPSPARTRAQVGDDGGDSPAPGGLNALMVVAGDVGPGADAPDSGADAFDPERDAVILTDPLKVDDFLVAGFTWTGGEGDAPPDDVRIYLRVRQSGEWSPWYLNEPSDAGRDDGAARAGTDELITGGADAVQASVVGDAADLPAGLTLALVPDRPSGERSLGAADVRAVGAGPTGVAGEAADEPAPAPGRAGSTAETGVGTTAGTTGDASAARLPSVALAAETDDPAALVTTREEWGANPA